LQRVIVATDDEEIFESAEQAGAEAMMTDAAHPSGTDRTTILNAFSKPHHISLIYDPHSDQIGFTCWDDGVLKTPSGCFIYEHKQPEDLVRQLMDARPE